jgi:transposase
MSRYDLTDFEWRLIEPLLAAGEDHQAVHIHPTLKRLVFSHDRVANLHDCPCHAMSSSGDRALRSGAMVVGREIAEPGIAASRQGKAPRLCGLRPPLGA